MPAEHSRYLGESNILRLHANSKLECKSLTSVNKIIQHHHIGPFHVYTLVGAFLGMWIPVDFSHRILILEVCLLSKNIVRLVIKTHVTKQVSGVSKFSIL